MVEYCSQCGAKIKKDSTFCEKCGHNITQKKSQKKSTKNKYVEIIEDKSAEEKQETKKREELESKHSKKYKKISSSVLILIVLLLVSSGIFSVYEMNKYNSLTNDYDSLSSSYNEKVSEYNTLSSRYDSMQSSYNSIQNNYDTLQNNYNSLQSSYNSLQNNYNSLQSSSDSYKRTVEIRYGDGADCEQFITPSNPSVISATTSALGHSSDGDPSWNDMIAINNYVGNNIKYNYDTFDGTREDCWLYPGETLSRGYGDCEDHALLMVSMCKAEGSATWLWCAEIKLQDGTGHMCVFVKVTGGNLFIFEPTSRPEYFFGWMIHGAWNSGTGKPVYQALQQYENECWSGQTVTVLKIFNEQTYNTFNNNQEFSNFWTK